MNYRPQWNLSSRFENRWKRNLFKNSTIISLPTSAKIRELVKPILMVCIRGIFKSVTFNIFFQLQMFAFFLIFKYKVSFLASKFSRETFFIIKFDTDAHSIYHHVFKSHNLQKFLYFSESTDFENVIAKTYLNYFNLIVKIGHINGDNFR